MCQIRYCHTAFYNDRIDIQCVRGSLVYARPQMRLHLDKGKNHLIETVVPVED